MVSQGAVGHGLVWQEGCVQVRFGLLGLGVAGMAWLGLARSCWLGCGTFGFGRNGKACLGAFW